MAVPTVVIRLVGPLVSESNYLIKWFSWPTYFTFKKTTASVVSNSPCLLSCYVQNPKKLVSSTTNHYYSFDWVGRGRVCSRSAVALDISCRRHRQQHRVFTPHKQFWWRRRPNQKGLVYCWVTAHECMRNFQILSSHHQAYENGMSIMCHTGMRSCMKRKCFRADNYILVFTFGFSDGWEIHSKRKGEEECMKDVLKNNFTLDTWHNMLQFIKWFHSFL